MVSSNCQFEEILHQVQCQTTNLCLNPNFHQRPCHGQHIAGYDEDVPAVHELQPVRQRHHFVVEGVVEPRKLLRERKQKPGSVQTHFHESRSSWKSAAHIEMSVYPKMQFHTLKPQT